jgi:hypothetical protein
MLIFTEKHLRPFLPVITTKTNKPVWFYQKTLKTSNVKKPSEHCLVSLLSLPLNVSIVIP